MFGNVNVDYKPCKTQIQLDRASRYMLGELYEQVQAGVVKTRPDLCGEMNCDRNIYSCDILTTRKLFGKRDNKRTNLAFKMSISFHPDDNDKLTYEEAFKIAKEFAEKFFQGYQVMFAVHTDTPHKHVHFLVSNCHIETGKAYRRSQKDLQEMCEFFGEQCMKRGLVNSVRENYYSNSDRDQEKIGEIRLKSKGKETFKDELREVINIEINDPNNCTSEDVINALQRHYHVECRVKGNTISYRHPNFKDKSGKLVSVRGSKLGEKYTVKGIEHELAEIRGRTANTREENGKILLFEGKTQSSCTTNTSKVEKRLYITDTGIRENGSTAVANTGTGKHRNMGGETGTADSRNDRGFQEGRTGSSNGNGNNKNVPTLEELFASYDRRNGTDKGKQSAKFEPSRTVRKRHQDIDR